MLIVHLGTAVGDIFRRKEELCRRLRLLRYSLTPARYLSAFAYKAPEAFEMKSRQASVDQTGRRQHSGRQCAANAAFEPCKMPETSIVGKKSRDLHVPPVSERRLRSDRHSRHLRSFVYVLVCAGLERLPYAGYESKRSANTLAPALS